MKKALGALLGLLILLPSLAYAVSAELIVSPTRIVLEGKKRFATVSVKNPGDAVGKYRVELVDTVMLKDGAVKMLDKDEKYDFSALKMLRASPRNVTLRPGESQAVRLLVKKPKDLGPGEYRSHLKVRMTETNIDPTTGKPVQDAEGISIRPKIVMVIPVIVRQGETEFKTQITQASVHAATENYPMPHVKVMVTLDGNQSVIGDFVITHNGKVLKDYAGIAIYRGTAERALTIPLDNLPSSGTMRIEYRGQNKQADGTMPVYSSYELSL